MKLLALRSAALGLLLAGCNVTEVPLPPSAFALNQCESHSECGLGYCAQGACVAAETELTHLLVEITPPSSSPGIGGVAFYKELVGQNVAGDDRFDLVVDRVVNLTGHVAVAEDACKPVFADPQAGSYVLDRSIPVDIAFTPSERVLGIATTAYMTSVPLTAAAERHEFELGVPPGTYDIYIKPKGPVVPGCEVPPRLILQQKVAGALVVNLPSPLRLPIHVGWPSPELSGFRVGLLDEATGRLISTEVVLGDAVWSEDKGLHVYTTEVFYTEVDPLPDPGVAGPLPSRNRMVRLTPPPDVVRPTVLARHLRADGEIWQLPRVPDNVTVSLQTAIAGLAVPVEAALTITATSLEGFNEGAIASYTTTVDVGPEGLAEVALPPGAYRVDAVPKGSSGGCSIEAIAADESPCLATASATWDVSQTPAFQAGKLIEFERATPVTGSASTWSGTPAAGAAVHATVSARSANPPFLDAKLGDSPSPPHASGGLVDPSGGFEFSADRGDFDFFVKPDSSTRFGWFAWPSFGVGVTTPINVRVSLPLPVVYSGQVLVDNGAGSRVPVPEALIRAYAFIDDDGARAVVQVAEARADADARFDLLIPAQFGPEPKQNFPMRDPPSPIGR